MTGQLVAHGREQPPFQSASAGAYAGDGSAAPYLSVNRDDLTATLVREPARPEVPVICDEQLVVEFYSR